MMENPGAANSTSNPLANVASPPQPQGAQGGNPLARLAPQMGGAPQQQPIPDRAQTTAAVKRLSAIQQAMKSVMADKAFGHENVRPALMDAGSRLLASKILSLPELMSELQTFPEQPIEQKQWVQRVFNQAQQAESAALDHHGAAVAAGKLPPDGGPQYDLANHDQHFQGMLSHYRKT